MPKLQNNVNMIRGIIIKILSILVINKLPTEAISKAPKAVFLDLSKAINITNVEKIKN
ncbi:unnamed protein product [marine sediment metagenome]|uniref:Uncharacterized protein n=1 Tax=marine sediment metagenome TaxID=412755 RepID=X0ZUX9_9ZZZZ